MKHKFFTLLLAVMASTSMLFALSGTCGDNLTWELTDGILTISGNGTMTNYSSSSSSSYAPWYSYRSSIKSVVIEEGVTSIGNYAFKACSGLASVTIPNSVTSIGGAAFNRCSSLTSVTIPNSVTSIGNYAFYGCDRLSKITIPENVRLIEYQALSQCTSLDTIIWNARDCQVEGGGVSITSASHSPFISSDCLSPISGSHIIFGEEVERVPDNLCIKFTSADFSKAVNLKTIGELAFAHSSINNLVLPINCDSIAEMAFLGCTSMKELTIPENVRYIGTNAFSNCVYLTQIHYNARRCSYATEAFLYRLGQNAEEYQGEKVTINIGASVQTIPARIFAGCTAENCSNSIGNIIFAENSECTWIGANAFVGQILTPYNVYYTPKSCEFNNQVFISDIDTLTISNSVDTIDLRYIAHANQIINRNPRLYVKAPNYFGNLFDYTNDGKMEWMYSGKENSLSNYYLYRTTSDALTFKIFL